jgi:hypothetical protein
MFSHIHCDQWFAYLVTSFETFVANTFDQSSTQLSHPSAEHLFANEYHKPSHPQNIHKMMFKFPHCLMEPNIHSHPLEHIITFGLPKSRSSTPQPIRGCRSRDRQEDDRGPDFEWVETCVEGGVKRRGVFGAVWCGAVWFWESDV